MMGDDDIVIWFSSLWAVGEDGGETGERTMLGHGHDLGKNARPQRPAAKIPKHGSAGGAHQPMGAVSSCRRCIRAH